MGLFDLVFVINVKLYIVIRSLMKNIIIAKDTFWTEQWGIMYSLRIMIRASKDWIILNHKVIATYSLILTVISTILI